MKRRQVLKAGAVALLGAGGGAVATAHGIGPLASNTSSQPAYYQDKPFVYERPPLLLRARPDAARRGDTITFEIHHTGESEDIPLGCHIPWAIQAYDEGEWNHAVWTGPRWHHLCATDIPPGETFTIPITLSETALAEKRAIGEVDVTFTPGTYRFILVLSNPPLAVNFQVLPTE